jgi:acetoin utilization deacetylase AcuC-like enzyme
MQIVFSEAQFAHDPQRFLVRGEWRDCPEKPDRARVLRQAVLDAGHQVAAPADFGAEPRKAVHSPAYLNFLVGAYDRWQALADAAPEIIPNIHPDRRHASYPDSIVGQAGFHMSDTACPIGPMTWLSAVASANCAVQATELVLAGARAAYALCRPPGHHAFTDVAGGFCYLNNVAIAAARAHRRYGRVAILDVDLHHGNGTQGIFYDRADVLTVSLHADPRVFYPFFWGHVEEQGEGPGHGFNLNLPLALGTADAGYMPVLDKALAAIRAYAPGLLVVALGLDASGSDPLAGLDISTAGFAEIARRIATLSLPTVLVQEGGYLTDELGRNLAAFLGAFEGRQSA